MKIRLFFLLHHLGFDLGYLIVTNKKSLRKYNLNDLELPFKCSYAINCFLYFENILFSNEPQRTTVQKMKRAI